MSAFYTDPEKEPEPFTLPDAEAFYMNAEDCADEDAEDSGYTGPGWYVWSCFPGCMPDSDPIGPYDTEAEAIIEFRRLFGAE